MRLQNKLFLFLFSFSLLLVTVLVLLMQWSIGKGMVEYVNTKEVEALQPLTLLLADEYRFNHNWQTMKNNHKTFHHLISQQLSGSDFDPRTHLKPKEHRFDRRPPPRKAPHQPPNKDRSERRNPPPPLMDAHYALLDHNKNLVVGNHLESLTYAYTAIEVDNQTVGYFAVSKRNRLTQGYEVDFIEQQQQDFWLIAIVSMGLVVLVTLPLARHVVEPLKLLTTGIHKLTQGDYQQAIHLTRQDELGQLSRDYNELALTLAANETARKRWLANISHELRTPVAILRGELEAMLDNVRPLTSANIASAHDEVKHLQRLIEDLHLLTSADIGGMHYRKQHQHLATLMHGEIERYRRYLADAGIHLKFGSIEPDSFIYGDSTRLCQLFENIINNCINYSSASEFHVSSAIAPTKNNDTNSNAIMLTFEDNGIGVDSEHLPHLFEHLYRVDSSRNRHLGGSGLGLSICRQIVIAHQGDIKAERSSLGGLAIVITLPITTVIHS